MSKKTDKELEEGGYINEVDVILTVAKDSRRIRLDFISPDAPFTVDSFILELETYLHEITQANDQMTKDGVEKH